MWCSALTKLRTFFFSLRTGCCKSRQGEQTDCNVTSRNPGPHDGIERIQTGIFMRSTDRKAFTHYLNVVMRFDVSDKGSSFHGIFRRRAFAQKVQSYCIVYVVSRTFEVR